VIIESDGHQITGVRGDPDHPANFGRLCTKGSTLHLTASQAITQQTRLLQPLQRLQRHGQTQPISWDGALDWAAQRFAHTITQHGSDAVGFYISGQLLTEDYYVFNKLAKGLIGTNNIDSNSRLCMSSAVVGYKQTLGMDAPPCCYDDVNHASTIFIVGANPAYAHPVLFRRIEDARRANPQLKIIVADPRRTDTADMADLYLPIQPGTDVMLFNGMLHLMLWEGWVDAAFIAAHTHGFEALKASVRGCTPELVAQICGISAEALLQAARLFAGVADQNTSKVIAVSLGESMATGQKATLSLYCQGLNQSSSGSAKNTALINLHLATGQIGKPGAGPFSLTGQPNAMGGREVGGMANLLSAHRDLANPVHRAEVAALWGVPSVPDKPGKTAVEMFQAAADGEIKALWIACTNPAQSLPDQATVRRALERAEFVVVQEAFATTATCRFADLLLPATTWGEKEGTVTNSERRISRVRAAVPPPNVVADSLVPLAVDESATPAALSEAAGSLDGEAFCSVSPARDAGSSLTCAERPTAQTPGYHGGSPRHDWAIAVDFAQRLECALGHVGPSLFPYDSPETIWNEHRESTRGRDLDITGLSYAMLEQSPQQWPLKEGDTVGKTRLYEDGLFPTPDGKARFVVSNYQPVAELRSARYPFSLTTGRLRDQWHGMSRTGTLGRLFGHAAEPSITLHPQDMARLQLQAGDLVTVSNPRGAILVPVVASAEVALNQAFMAMHWGEEFLSGRSATGERLAGVNTLTTPVYCPDSKQPEFKHTAVKLQKVQLPWNLLAMAWLPADAVLTARTELQALMGDCAFASCVLFSHGQNQAAAADTPGGTPRLAATPERCGLLFRAAHPTPLPTTLLEKMEAVLQLHGGDILRYADPKRGQRRTIRLREARGQTLLEGFLLAGDTRAQGWIITLLKESLPAQAYGRTLLLPGATAPLPVVSRGAPVCACFNVTDLAIQSHLQTCTGEPGERLLSLQSALKCGTNCGSCAPQLQRMVRQTAQPQSASL
jgi:assimilatory nitrate reductase catalytic subunit